MSNRLNFEKSRSIDRLGAAMVRQRKILKILKRENTKLRQELEKLKAENRESIEYKRSKWGV